MSAELIQAWAWQAQPKSPTAKYVLITLAKHGDWDTFDCYPSQAYLAQLTGLSERCVRDSLSALEAEGFIRRTKRNQGACRQPDLIDLLVTEVVLRPAKNVGSDRQIMSKRPAPAAGNPLRELSVGTHARERAPLFDDDELPAVVELPPGPTFEQFWRAYPSKVGKGAAQKSWMKALAKVTSGDILKAVEAQRSTERWRKGIVPNPATWLNQERWSDETGPALGLGGQPDWC